MTIYQKNIRENLINKGLHLNDDTETYKIGHIDHQYDLEEHEQYV